MSRAAALVGSNMKRMNQQESVYEAIGEDTFTALVRGFYEQVEHDDILGPMYPTDDMDGAEERLRLFLIQYWGGPTTYTEQRGHPRLRMRHAPFPIDAEAAERWLTLMKRSMDQLSSEQLIDAHRAALWDHMVRVAYMLINRTTPS